MEQPSDQRFSGPRLAGDQYRSPRGRESTGQLEDLPPARVVADQAELSGDPFDPVALALGRPLSRRRRGRMHGERRRRHGYSENPRGKRRGAGIGGLCLGGVYGQDPRLQAAFPLHRNRDVRLDRCRGSRSQRRRHRLCRGRIGRLARPRLALLERLQDRGPQLRRRDRVFQHRHRAEPQGLLGPIRVESRE